jgi:hypothetical protein
VRAVNLLPKDAAKPQRRTPNPLALVGGGGGLVVVAALGLMTMNAGGALVEKQDAVADAETRLAALPQPEGPESPADAGLLQEQQQRSTALTAALGTRVPWDRVLRRFSLVLPEDVWLTSLAAKAPVAGATPAAPAAPTGFTIVGYTYSHDGVARLLSRLAVVPDLTNIQLQRSALGEIAGRKIVEFSIVADVKAEVPQS